MQTPDNFQDKRLSRQEYNKRYYQQNRDKLLQKRKKQSEKTGSPELSEKIPVGPNPSEKIERNILTKIIRTIELLALFTLTVVMTLLLVKESAGFYLDANETPVSAYMKAGMIELAAILFSFSRGRGLLLQWGQRGIVVMLCGLSLWTMSQRVVKTASQDSAKVQASLRIIHELETERSQKEILREQFLKRGWLNMTRRYEKGLEQILERIISAQQGMATLQTPRVVANSLAVMIAFRLALLLANLISVHRIAELFGYETMRYQRE